MKKLTGLLVFIAAVAGVKAQHSATDTFHLYNTTENAAEGIAKAVAQAKQQHKFVMVMAGGNWCIWCLRFNKFITEDAQIDSLVKANFVVYHLNYSKENYNQNVFAQYKFPQRFGFPVFVVLDENGQQLHTQNSGYLEEGKGYSKEKVMGFFTDWRPDALNAKNYVNP